jgi:streptogramin lyase
VNRVARITPQGVITEFVVPGFAFPKAITAGPDGNVWFTGGSNGKIGRITPSGAIRMVRFSAAQDTAGGITTGPDGNIWFTGSSENKVWRFDLATKVLTSFDIPTASAFPRDIITGPDGNLWFLEGAGRIARITPSGQITEFTEPLSLPFAVTAGPDGNVWFVERFSQRIGRVTPSGQFTFFTTVLHTLESIVTGPDGNLYFTSFADDRLGRITPQGVITEMPVAPGDPAPTGLCVGPAGPVPTLWFLGYGSNEVFLMTVP